jgi:hypothetical protein
LRRRGAPEKSTFSTSDPVQNRSVSGLAACSISRRNRSDNVQRSFTFNIFKGVKDMEKTLPASLTVEEAVAEMVYMDYIPIGFTLLEMVDAFQEEAEIEYENACIDRLPEDQLTPLKNRMDSCRARHALAESLLKSLNYEVKNPKNSKIVFAKDSSSHPRLTRDSVWKWATDIFGIGNSMWSKDSKPVNEKLKNVRWEDVTIKIWQNYYIKYSFKKNSKTSHFNEIGLMGKSKTDVPNQLGKILLILGLGKEIPDGDCVRCKGTLPMCRTAKLFRNWTGLSNDPFISPDGNDGWKPRFKLKFFQEDYADYYAKNKSSDVPYDEHRLSNNPRNSDESSD